MVDKVDILVVRRNKVEVIEVLVSNLVVEHMEVPYKVVSMVVDMVVGKEAGRVVGMLDIMMV